MKRLLFLVLFAVAVLSSAAVSGQPAAPDAGVVAPSPEAERFQAIEALQDKLDGLEKDRRSTEGQERELIVEQIAEKREQLRNEVNGLVQVLTADGAAKQPEEVMTRAQRLLQRERRRISADLKDADSVVSEAKNAAVSATSPVDRGKAEEELAAANERAVGLLRQKQSNTQLRAQLGANVTKDYAELDELLETRARRLSALIEAARDERTAIDTRPAATDDERKAKKGELETVTRRIEAAAGSMRKLIVLMKERNLDTTAYQRLLIEATGRVTTDVFDREVTMGLIDSWLERGEEWVAEHAPQAFFALLLFAFIMFASWGISRVVRRVVRRSVDRTEMSVLAREFAVRSSGRAVIVVGLLTGLSQLGIEMAPVLAGLGIAGFVVGFALQDTLSNFAAGMMILVYRPFDVGDLVEVAVSGKVDQMTLVSTSVLTLDNQQLIIPNNKIWNNVIRNVTAQDRRRVDFVFGVSYDDDIEKVMTVLRDICANTENVEADGEIVVALHSFGDSSVNFVVRVWTATDNYWQVFWAINAEVKRRFDAEDISIPYPQRDVHMHQKAA